MYWRSKVRKMCLSSGNALYMVTKYPWATNCNYNLPFLPKQLGQATGRTRKMGLGHFQRRGIKGLRKNLKQFCMLRALKC